MLQQHYEAVTTDWSGTLYSGITIKWDYILRKVHTSMPGYLPKALYQFQHDATDSFTFSSHPYTPPTYGLKVQMAKVEITVPTLNKKENTRIRQVVGKILFYAQAIDSNLLMGLNTIASQQENETARTAALVTHLLNYCATYPNSVVTYDTSDMILHIHPDASFLSKPKAKIRGVGYFFLLDFPEDPTKAMNNAPIHILCQI